jgi:hypothetical protein
MPGESNDGIVQHEPDFSAAWWVLLLNVPYSIILVSLKVTNPSGHVTSTWPVLSHAIFSVHRMANAMGCSVAKARPHIPVGSGVLAVII